ncbi:UPF0598 protein CG30010 [Nilaparvata lugens]|uniref:UPF0598 protein CG30010 n=1 Tax=Nilaparvata lugens TaxID=108931 RepID=UPI00193C9BBA|nr:UPF0598 protein CG30010 [Nilaparvata lugens]
MKNFTSCFKEKKFLEFFFSRLRPNKTGRYEAEFPFVSLCGPERNFVRCDDKPIVFTKLVKTDDNKDILFYAHSDLLRFSFEPAKLCMVPETGRVYHPSPPKTHPIGLVRSKLAIELSQHFRFENGEDKPPTQFEWEGNVYQTDNEWYKNIL